MADNWLDDIRIKPQFGGFKGPEEGPKGEKADVTTMDDVEEAVHRVTSTEVQETLENFPEQIYQPHPNSKMGEHAKIAELMKRTADQYQAITGKRPKIGYGGVTVDGKVSFPKIKSPSEYGIPKAVGIEYPYPKLEKYQGRDHGLTKYEHDGILMSPNFNNEGARSAREFAYQDMGFRAFSWGIDLSYDAYVLQDRDGRLYRVGREIMDR